MQERLPIRPSMMPWSERAKTAVVIELTVQSEENSGEVKQGYCLMWTAPNLWEVLSVRKATKGQEEEETEKLS